MWRLGFLFWRFWVWARVLIPAVLVLWVIAHAYGITSVPFRTTLIFLTGTATGAGFVLADLARRELGGTLGRNRR